MNQLLLTKEIYDCVVAGENAYQKLRTRTEEIRQATGNISSNELRDLLENEDARLRQERDARQRQGKGFVALMDEEMQMIALAGRVLADLSDVTPAGLDKKREVARQCSELVNKPNDEMTLEASIHLLSECGGDATKYKVEFSALFPEDDDE